MSRRHDLRRIKAHLSYTSFELADALHVNIGTIRVWTREGLKPIPGIWPYLFAPADIRAFLERRMKPRRRLAAGELLCVACKEHRRPAEGMVDLMRRSATSADLVGNCPVCGRRMHRRARLAALEDALGTLKLRYQDGSVPIRINGAAPRTGLLAGAGA
jgi:hypothetical protein